jgi:hypothetical protein
MRKGVWRESSVTKNIREKLISAFVSETCYDKLVKFEDKYRKMRRKEIIENAIIKYIK